MPRRIQQDGEPAVLLPGTVVLVVDPVPVLEVEVELGGVWDRSMIFGSQSAEAVAELFILLRRKKQLLLTWMVGGVLLIGSTYVECHGHLAMVSFSNPIHGLSTVPCRLRYFAASDMELDGHPTLSAHPCVPSQHIHGC